MQAQQEVERFKQDAQYFEEHRDALLERYSEQWVAIYDGKVAGAGHDVDNLLEDLHSRGIPVGHAVIEYLTRKEDILILPA